MQKRFVKIEEMEAAAIFSVLILTLTVLAESPIIERISFRYIRRKVY
jgi:hypothetical protein